MILVHHKAEPPELVRQARRRLARLRKAWARIDSSDPEAVERFVKQHDAEFDRGYRVAWSALQTQWYGRCAYCGAELHKSDPIDHFRPRRPHRPQHQGYWWLTWTWRNLLPACSTCNGAKDNAFPVKGKRLSVWDDDLGAEGTERAGLIDPSREDPLAELEFVCEDFQGRERWTVQAKRSTGRGATTVRTLGLDEDDERYSLHLQRLEQLLYDLQRALDEGPGRLREVWARKTRHLLCTEPGHRAQPFPALSRAYLLHHFGEPIEAHGLELPTLGDSARSTVPLARATPSRAALGLNVELMRDLDSLSLRPPREETHRLLVELVAVRSWTLTELGELFPQSQASLKRHLRDLARQGRLIFDGELARSQS